MSRTTALLMVGVLRSAGAIAAAIVLFTMAESVSMILQANREDAALKK